MSLLKKKVNLLEKNAETIKDLAIKFPNALLETLAARTDIEYGIQTELLDNPFLGAVIPGTNKHFEVRPFPKLHNIEDVWSYLYEDGMRYGSHVISYKAKIKGVDISLNIADYSPIAIKRCIDNLAKVIPKEHTSFWVYQSKNGEFPYRGIDKKSIAPIEELFKFNIRSDIIKKDFENGDYLKKWEYEEFCKNLGSKITNEENVNFSEGGYTYYHFYKMLTPFETPFTIKDFHNILSTGKNLLGIYLEHIINANSRFKEEVTEKYD